MFILDEPPIEQKGDLAMSNEENSAAESKVAVIPSMPFDENTYVAHREGGSECVIFDPGTEPGKIIGYLEQESLTPAAILLTHGHSDHIAGNATIKERWPACPIVIGQGDADKLTDPVKNLSAGYGIELLSPPADTTVTGGEIYEVAGYKFEVRDTPGHSIGHVVFIDQSAEPTQVFGGDVLFQGSIGRTDFPDGDFGQLEAAIHEQLFTLPDDTIVLPGHGPATTIGKEKRANPFVGAPAGYQG